ncbi:MAG: Uma2 family endonuclease [Pirellulales bacterium]|nr:Uma2 family endonuclease [Pirellulales bacterium]
MATVEKIMTADEYLALGDIGPSALIQGELVLMSPTGYNHGWIANNIGIALGIFVKSKKLGRVSSSEAGFYIARNPDTVRAPDVAFVRAERIPPGGQKKFFEGPPDLAVEVLSPDDRSSEVNAKIRDWLQAGCVQVWVVDPQTESVMVYRSPRDIAVFAEQDILTAPELLPGFSLPVAEIFE